MTGVLGVCGGNGVILAPFARRGLLANIEPRSAFSTPNDIQWRANFKAPVEIDLTSTWANVDVIVGAPDCGHSSVLSYSRAKKLSNPSDNKSLTLYISALKKYKPKMFLMENLPKMLDNYPKLVPFLEKKYHVTLITEPVSFWGNSQVNRKRLVLVGIRKDQDIAKYEKVLQSANSKFSSKPLKTSAELISGLGRLNPSNGHVREPYDYQVPLYYQGRRKLTTLEAKEIWNNEFLGESRWEVNMERMKFQPGVYRNLANEYPKTVRKQNRQFNHLGDMLTPREMARIQGVPDHFKLWIDENRLLYCINKGRTTIAKSPPYEIGSWFYFIVSRVL